MKKNKKSKNKKEIIDLTNYIAPDDVKFDTEGSYTGTTADTYYTDDAEDPVQDADDL